MDFKKLNAYFDKNKDQFYTKMHKEEKKKLTDASRTSKDKK